MAARPAAVRSTATPPGTTRSIMNRCPNSARLVRSSRSLSRAIWYQRKANAASLAIAPRSPQWLAIRSRSSSSARIQCARSGTAQPLIDSSAMQ